MRTAILDADTLGEDMDLSVYEKYGDVRVYKATKPEEVSRRAEDADIIIVNKVKCNRQSLAGMDRLKLICVAATGYDNIELDYCREKGIAVCNVPGYSTDSVAQLTAAMVFSLSTNLPRFSQSVADGTYSAGKSANILTPVYHDLAGKTWGIIGYGNIGRRVGAVAEAVGCNILICRRHPAGDERECDIDRLCEKSDIISVHTPLNDGTRGLISRERIVKMKNGVIIVNVARGLVTDERAIADGIISGKIGGFGCDVYSAEPFGEDHPFYGIKDNANVCLTPHMAWGSYESRKRCIDMMDENISSFLSGGKIHRIDL